MNWLGVVMINKLSEIERLANGDDCNLGNILILTEDEDEEVRFRAIESLQEFSPNEKMVKRVRESLADNDELVKIASIELIGDWKDSGSLEKLYFLLEDDSEIVRSSTAISIAEIGNKESLKILEARALLTSNGIEKVSLNVALYILGDKKYFSEALNQLSNENYLVRCSVVNLLSYFVNEDDTEEAISSFKNALMKEKKESVISTIESAIDKLQQPP